MRENPDRRHEPESGDGVATEAIGEEQGDLGAAPHRRVRELAADAVPVAMIAVHNNGTLALANAAARRLFGVSMGHVGRAFQDLEISHRPTELRSALEKVKTELRPLVLEQVPWPDGPETIDCFEIHVAPVLDAGGAVLGVAVTFIDVTLSQRLHDELELSTRDLETAYEELRSAIEELETTNEEIQSTNEELDTMNAELKSFNEELQTINDELRTRTAELDEVNDFLQSMLLSHQGALVVIDRDLRVSVWNGLSAELWGLRPDEVPGRHFLNLDIGLPVEELRPAIRAVLAGRSREEIVELDATNRRGRELRCHISLTPLVDRDQEVRGVIITAEEVGR
jgi:two-component system CheB/CheR fusion protein